MRQVILPSRSGLISEGSLVQETINVTDSLVIIGANGSGKSRLGLMIEMLTPNNYAKRISAQRLLTVPDFAPIMSYEQSLQNFINSWQNRQVIEIQNDYQSVLSIVFAKSSKRDSDYIKDCQLNTTNIQLEIPESTIEKLIKIWNDVLPHRNIHLTDSKVTVTSPDGLQYSGTQMSDGERVALYLISQCLVVPENFTVIIDEPELHLHKSLMNRLWTRIEKERKDCLFVYITHDLDFAASRVKATKIWVKSFNINVWNWQFVPDSNEIPENLLLEIIGSRKPILFVEGEKGSYDHAIYQHFYPNFNVIPRGSGSKVIESTKGINFNESLHSINAFGLIDRDYRVDEEIEFLIRNKISILEVAEVENLLLTPDIIKIVAQHLALDSEVILTNIQNYIISVLQDNLEREVSYTTSLEINFMLNTFDNKKQGKLLINEAIKDLINSIDVNSIYDKNFSIYENIIKTKDIKLALKHFTHKGLLPNVSRFFGLNGHNYSKLVLRLLKTEKEEQILNALKEYLPNENTLLSNSSH